MEKENKIVIDKDERLEFCSLKQSIELKELGLILDSPFGYYDNDGELVIFGDEVFYDGTSAPLYQQAFRFFREKYGLYGCVRMGEVAFFFDIEEDGGDDVWSIEFDTYEQAEQACLDKLIEIARGVSDSDKTKEK